MHYLCSVFFMVLDLRLTMKIGCRDDNLFLLSEKHFQKTVNFLRKFHSLLIESANNILSFPNRRNSSVSISLMLCLAIKQKGRFFPVFRGDS